MYLDPFTLYWLSVANWLWQRCLRITADCHNGFGNSSTKQTTVTTEYANSFNRSDSYASSVTTGDTSLSLGGTGSGGGNTVTDYFFLVVGLLGVLGGLLIFNR